MTCKVQLFCRRDEYPEIITRAYNLLVSQSRELNNNNNNNRLGNPRFNRGGGGRYSRGRGRAVLMHIHTGRGRVKGRDGSRDQGNNTLTRTNTDNIEKLVAGNDGEAKENIECLGCHFFMLPWGMHV